MPSFPKDLFQLFNQACGEDLESGSCVCADCAGEADVRFLLKEYGQRDERDGCERRWVEFVGVPWERRGCWVKEGGCAV